MSAMNAEFFDAIEQIEKEKGIPADTCRRRSSRLF